MARSRGVVTTGLTEVTISTAGTFYTVLQILPSTSVPAAIKGFSVSFDGTTVTDPPVQVILQSHSGAGTGGTAVTALKEGGGGAAIVTTALKGPFTSDPSSGTTDTSVIRAYEVHPQTGLEVRFSPEDELLVGGGLSGLSRIALAVKVGSAPVNCSAHISFEE